MSYKIGGIHHITAIGSDPQRLVNFYTQVLGLRLVKKSVNQDDVSAYHLFFGDKTGEPGMDLTFFTFPGVMEGRRGTGLLTTIYLAVPKESLSFWQQRFDQLKVKHEGLTFYDPDNQRLELVGVKPNDLDNQQDKLWVTKEISKANAIRHFYSARLTVANLDLIEPILTEILGYKKIEGDKHISHYRLPGVKRAAFLDVEQSPDEVAGLNASGTVHHIAFRVDSEKEQLAVREKVMAFGLYPTPVIDRYYFKSVYFRTPAGILFEIATAGPGFTVDEAEKDLGKKLALPPFLEAERQQIEANLDEIHLPG